MARTSFRTIDDATDTGSTLATELNAWRLSILTSFSGSGAPTGLFLQDNLMYMDTASDTNRVYKHYNGSNHIPIFISKKANNGTIMFTGGSADTGFQKDSTNGQMTFLSQNVKKMMFGNAKMEIGAGGNPRYTIDCTTTDAIKVPVGSTAQRPAGHDGCIRYNSDSSVKRMEVKVNGAWKRLAHTDDTSSLGVAVSALNSLTPANRRFAVYTGANSAEMWRVLDEANMASNSHEAVITQGSYLDHQATRKLRDLADVQNHDPQNGEVPTYNSAQSRYEPKSIAGALGSNAIGAEQMNITS